MEILTSSLIYFFTFFLSIIFSAVGQRLYSGGRKNIFWRNIFFLMAVLLPCLLAGFRANSVGIDVMAYIVPDMRVSSSMRDVSFFECCTRLDRAPEYLYMLLVYICSRITADEGLLLFLIQLFTIGPILLAAIQLRNEISIPLAVATYLFCFYNNTLNNMRQSVACALILLAAAYYFKNEMRLNAKTVVCFVMACLFHNSAFIGVAAIYVLCRISTLKLKRWTYFVIYACIIVLPVAITPLYETLSARGLTNEKFQYYADIFLYQTIRNDWIFGQITRGYIAIALCLFARLAVPCFCLRHYDTPDRLKMARVSCIRSAAICGTLIYFIIQFAMKTIYGNRLSIFFDMFIVLLVPYAAWGRNRKEKTWILYMMVFVFWVLYVILLRFSGETHIYKFRF